MQGVPGVGREGPGQRADLGCQVQEGISGERAYGQAQEGLDDVVGGPAAGGADEKQEAEN